MTTTVSRTSDAPPAVTSMVPWILVQTLVQRRRSLLYWMAGLAGFGLYIGAFFPSIEGNEALNEMLNDLPPYLEAIMGQVSSFTTATGFLDAKVFVLTGPVIFLAFTIAFGISIVAGEERAGTLDLILAYPLSRTRLVIEKYAAMALATALLVASQGVGMWTASVAYDFDLSVSGLAAVSFHLWLLAMSLGTLALLIANAFGGRAMAAGIGALVAFVSYLVNSLAGLSEVAEALRPYSLFYYYRGHDPFTRGVDWNDVAALGAFSLVCLAASIVAVNRRDLSAGDG